MKYYHDTVYNLILLHNPENDKIVKIDLDSDYAKVISDAAKNGKYIPTHEGVKEISVEEYLEFLTNIFYFTIL